MQTAFYDAVRETVFGGSLSQALIEGIETINAAWSRHGDGDSRKLAYLLATACHETDRKMQPIHEYGGKLYFEKYDLGTKLGTELGNTMKGDGYRFRGRGFVQLTGRRNFARAARAVGVDIVKEPDKALDPKIAADILVKGCLGGWFTTKKLGDYISPSKADYAGARRVVNGTDRAALIAMYATKFEHALAQKPAKAPKPVSATHVPAKPVAPSPAPAVPPRRGFWSTVWANFSKH